MRDIGDRYLEDGIEYEIVDTKTETKEDGTIVIIENVIAAPE